MNDWSRDGTDQPCDGPSPRRQSARPVRSQLRPARKTLPFVPYADWSPGQPYDEQLPPSYMHYVMEWKLTLNKRVVAKQTEDDLVLAPSDFWNEKLSS